MEPQHRKESIRGFQEGLAEHEALCAAAELAAAMIDPMHILDSDDPVKTLALGVVANLTQEIRGKERQDLAVRIANEVLGGS